MAKKPEIPDQPSIGTEAPSPATNGSAGRLPKNKSPRKERKRPARKTAVEKQKSADPEISDDAIRMRAYFIAEERMRKSIAGDPHSDWIEARRQLLAELTQV